MASFVSFVWFLVRVIPKPSRAAYSCQRAAAPMASAFVVWLLAVLGAGAAWRRSLRFWRERLTSKACLWVLAAVAAAGLALSALPTSSGIAAEGDLHPPIGEGRGLHPGRVVWVHAPDATDWPGWQAPQPWWHSNHTDLAVVEAMVSRGLQSLTGADSDETAWKALFEQFNTTHGRGAWGYQTGEVVVIKLNLTGLNVGSSYDKVNYDKQPSEYYRVDNSPQVVLALLRQLVYRAAIPPDHIRVGDTTAIFPKFLWDALHPEFPEVKYFDALGQFGRMRTEFSTNRFYWSTTAANGKRQDYIPQPIAEADYLINVPLLKTHTDGVTLCGKNHYGSMLRCPDGTLRTVYDSTYYDLHNSLPHITPGRGKYRAIVDLMGHRDLGGKTLLCIIDGLFGGQGWECKPVRWVMPPFGDDEGSDWPSSLFFSQDQVAIDSVGYDFLRAEWPNWVSGGTGAPGSLQGGAEDYLHEAALAHNPPSGTFYDPERDGIRMISLGVHEHWNNATQKQYSRNLGSTTGIELLAEHVAASPPRLSVLPGQPGTVVVSWPSAYSGYQLHSAFSLEPSAIWSPVSAPTFLVRDQVQVTNVSTGTARFFRLVK